MPRSMRSAMLFLILSLLIGGTWWAYQPYRPADAARVVDALLQAATAPPAPERRFSVPWPKLATCRQAGVFHPFQSNGHHLLQVLTGRPAPREISIDYPDCLVRFDLRKDATGQWRLVRVQSHAG